MPTDRNKEPKPGSGSIQIRLEVPPPGTAEIAGTTPDDGEEGEEHKRKYTLIVGPKTEIKRNIDRIRRGFVKYTVVPSARSEEKDLTPSTWTAYGRMLRDILADSPARRLQDVVLQATDALRGILQDEANSLKTVAKSTAYVDDLAFQFTKEGNPLELLRNLSIAVSYGGRTEDLGLSGTGTQSAVIIGVLELCLRYRAKSAIRLFAVEEPELFLHPHAQRHIASLLRKICARI